jgi:hypothetical protein
MAAEIKNRSSAPSFLLHRTSPIFSGTRLIRYRCCAPGRFQRPWFPSGSGSRAFAVMAKLLRFPSPSIFVGPEDIYPLLMRMLHLRPPFRLRLCRRSHGSATRDLCRMANAPPPQRGGAPTISVAPGQRIENRRCC